MREKMKFPLSIAMEEPWKKLAPGHSLVVVPGYNTYMADTRFAPSQWEAALLVTTSFIGWVEA